MMQETPPEWILANRNVKENNPGLYQLLEKDYQPVSQTFEREKRWRTYNYEIDGFILYRHVGESNRF
jgi:hypothetical protein